MADDMPGALRRSAAVAAVGALLLIGAAAAAPQAEAGLIRGLQRIVGGVLAVPLSTLAGTFSGPPIIGTLTGAFSGTLGGAGMILGGAFEVVSSAVPLAKAAAPYALPFLFL